ncbi:hypothetical protein K1T71_011336 [Dendrolimus kikuchii]|uniref:Uncharacterized protein n=1 Tax=Dendrolimus kikuchii TaxID=765133 RepID=A0ACC1CNK8_9NEOP|nr:hypothetical protein K1T71_011336 [Dendrolimus kikuchii]
MSKNTLIELSRCSIRVGHHQETQLTCSNSYLASVCEEGINVFDYSYNLRCTDKQIDHLRYYIPVSKISPTTGLFKKFNFKSGMKNSQMTEMVLDPALWPHNDQLMEEATKYMIACWSPAGFMQNSDHVLAVLNCVGNVNIYAQNLQRWSNVFNLSSLVKKQFPEHFKVEHNFDSIRKAAHALVTHSICWASEKNDDNSCYFVTAQRNATILFWCLQPGETNIKGNYMGKFDSNFGEIVNMNWIHKTKTEFLLLCSEIKGQLVAYNCKVVNNKISVCEKHVMWEHPDHMFVKSIHFFYIDHFLIIVFNKNRHVIFQVYDKDMLCIAQDIRKLNDYRVTDFVNSPDGLLVSTVNGNIYKIKVDIINDTLNVDITTMVVLDIASSMELYSMCLTKNNLIYILGMVDRKIKLRKEPDFIDIIFTTTEKDLDHIIDIILNNTSRKLTDFWDCIELLRYKIHKTKRMPELDYNQLYSDAENDVYKLKIYFMLLVFYTELGVMKNYYLKMPETSIEYVKEKLLVHHAVSLIHKIEDSYHTNGVWNAKEIEYITGAKKYLEFFCRKNKRNINDLVKTSIFDKIKSNFSYTCQCCDNEIEEFTCKEGHLNMLCSLSFTPILSDEYLFCKICDMTARTDLGILKPLCVVCDFRLYRYH